MTSAASQNRQTGRRARVPSGFGQSARGSVARTRGTAAANAVAVEGSDAEAAAEARAVSSSSSNRRNARRRSAEGCAMLGPMSERPRLSELRVPTVRELDFARLRAARLARLQTMLRRHDFPVALLYSTRTIRYATGVDVMSVWTAGTFARYCLVPAEGAPILCEYSGSMHVSRKLLRDVRPAYTWRFGGLAAHDKAREWARSIRATLAELGLERERLAVDKLDAVGFLALQAEGIAIVDVRPATVDAREGKTREEVERG